MKGTTDASVRVVIFGGGSDLWLVAALMKTQLPSKVEILLVEDIVINQTSAISVRLDDPILTALKIEQAQLQQAPSASFTLGTELKNWRGENSAHFLAGSGSLPEIDDIPIHQIMRHAASTHSEPDRLSYLYQPFQFPKRMVDAGKMDWMSTDPRSPLNMVRPTVQIRRSDFTRILRDCCDDMVVQKATPVSVEKSSDTGDLKSVILSDGSVVDADFFVDLSGELGGLIDETQSQIWEPVLQMSPFDRVASLELEQEPDQAPSVCSATALPSALLMNVSLRNGMDRHLLFADEFLDHAGVREILDGEAKISAFSPGYSARPWIGNCARLGQASAQFGTFLTSDQMILNRDAMMLLDFFPSQLDMKIEANAFNRKRQTMVEQIRDIVLMPFHLNKKDDPVWQSAQRKELPDTAKIRLQQFRSRGRFVAFEDEQFDQQSWIDLMIGFDIVPERADPMVRSIDMNQTARKLKNLAKAFDHAVMNATAYAEFQNYSKI
ncbi:MAG: hypothetical protein Pars2KO_20850 [Parasphingorhabdus sp.]